MTNKTIALFAVAASAFGTAAANAEELAGEVTLGYEGEYVFRGIQLASTSLQAAVDFAYGDFYGGIWTSQPASDVSVNNEIDYYAGYQFVVSDLITADAGLTYYQYPDAPSSVAEDTTEVYFGLNLDAVLAPSLYFFYDFDLKQMTLEASVDHEFELDDKNTIVVGAYGGYSDPDDASSYWYYGISADIVYSLSENSSVSVGVRTSGNDSNLGPNGRDANFWGGVTFTSGY